MDLGNFEYTEVSGLLDKLENLIEDGKTSFLSGKVGIDKEEVLETIKDIRLNLPNEVRQSTMIVEERRKIISDAQKEADVIRKGAYEHRENMIEQNHVTQYAKDKADSMILAAQENAKNIQYGAIDYAEHICYSVEEKLKKTLEMMHEQIRKFEEYATSILDEIETNRNELEEMRTKLQEVGE